MGVTYRFKKTNASVSTVNWSDLFNLYIVATSATVGYPIFDAVKLKKVRLYQMPIMNTSSTGFALAPAKIIFNGNPAGTSFGSDRMAQCEAGPFGGSCSLKPAPPCDGWLNSVTAGIAFSVYGPIGLVVDVSLSVQLAGGITGAGTAVASTGATIGRIYGNYLDASSTQFLQNDVATNNTLVWL